MKKNKGFTLAEMLIVVAIIGILVGITTAVIQTSLEKAREATDLANIKAAFAEVAEYAISGDSTGMPSYIKKSQNNNYYTYVRVTQTKKGWQSTGLPMFNADRVEIEGTTVTANFTKNTEKAYKITFYTSTHYDNNTEKETSYEVSLMTISNLTGNPIYYKTGESVKTN